MRALCLAAIFVLLSTRPAPASISPTTIVEMRQITSVSVSPSGQLAIVGICHPNPRTNRRELSWVIVPLRENSPPKVVAAGEEIYDPSAPGALLSRQALWSPDSKWFFYLRRDGEEVQLWETRSDGRMTRQVTHSRSDLIDLKRSSDPNEFIVQLAPERAVLRKAEQDEDRSGVLYDDHIISGSFLITRTLPIIDRWRSVRRTDDGEWMPPGWSGRTNAVFSVPLHKLKAASATIPSAYAPSERASKRVTVVALSALPKDPRDYAGKYTLQLESKADGGAIIKCEIAECIANRITVIGWSPGDTEIYYIADSLLGPLDSSFRGGAAMYAWNPRDRAVRVIHDTGSEGLWGRLYNLDAAAGLSLEPVPIVGREIVLGFTGADQPPRLETINLDTGVSRILFDPNAELRSLTQKRAISHRWETAIGYAGRGIVVLPDDYRPGEKYPAVINTYTCGDGFLHGGGTDGAPEFVLAHQGFIAICVDIRVREIIARETDLTRIYPIICDIVLGVVTDLSQDGKLDPTRVGLTGQSLGANAGAYCISHSNSFSAAAFRHGSAPERARAELFDTSAWMHGPEGIYTKLQLPDLRNDPTGKWDELSASHHARDINTPTLIQTDVAGGHLGALPLWSAMRREGKAIEMHIFPEDTHALIQPIHMLVNFERQLDWFRFWLKHEEDAAPSKRDQYARWHRLRELTTSSQQQH